MVTESTQPERLADAPTRETLERILDEMIERPNDFELLRARIQEIFRQEKAILILDLSGFTRTTYMEGVIPFMLMIYQMQKLALPCIEDHGGILIRTDGDNLTCLLDSVDHAVGASLEIIDRLESANVILPSGRDLYASIGIGYGPVLNVGNGAIYGNQVNLASKLGEDLANSGEIFLTEAAYEQIAGSEIKCSEHHLAISGIELTYYAVQK